MRKFFEIKENRSSDCYLGTVDHKSQTGKLVIAAIRREWKQRGVLDGKNYRVALQGRLGKNNPKASEYSKFGGFRRWNTHQRIRLEDAAHADLYVWERRACQW